MYHGPHKTYSQKLRRAYCGDTLIATAEELEQTARELRNRAQDLENARNNRFDFGDKRAVVRAANKLFEVWKNDPSCNIESHIFTFEYYVNTDHLLALFERKRDAHLFDRQRARDDTIRKLRLKGWKPAKLAEKFGISTPRVYQICKPKA